MNKYVAFGIMTACLSVVGIGVASGVQANLFYPFLSPSNYQAPGHVDANGNILGAEGGQMVFNITASSVVKASSGFLARVYVVSAPSTAVTIYDAATLGAASTVNKAAVITSSAGETVQQVQIPVVNGIVVDPGASGVVAVKYQ
ncbi:MAG TPA: hypothetical protein VFM18_12530 [Methanosarcina sp.]|nr:hypothetical protein [Methanosarcina sp.]